MKKQKRRLTVLSTVALIFSAAAFSLTGCVPVVIGSAGLVTGYILSNDSATGNVNTEYRVLWDLCLDTLEDLEGQVIEVNESKGLIKARVSENDVVIRIDSLSPKTQRLKVSARKLFLPKPQYAQKLFIKFVNRLE